MEFLNALSVAGTTGDMLPVDFNKGRNLAQFDSGKAQDINSSHELSAEKLQKVGVWEFSGRENTLVMAIGSWHAAEVVNSV